jgi:hypothetical protein
VVQSNLQEKPALMHLLQACAGVCNAQVGLQLLSLSLSLLLLLVLSSLGVQKYSTPRHARIPKITPGAAHAQISSTDRV